MRVHVIQTGTYDDAFRQAAESGRSWIRMG